jgi:DNA-binding transcriptional regulator YdaS (Cro superfamily)
MTESTALARGNQTDLANRLGVSRQAVSQMVKKGVVKVEPDGKILFEQAVEDWQGQVNVGQQRPFRWKGAKTKSYREQMERYHIARARREIAEAELAEIELATKKGELLDAKVTKKLLVDAVHTTRDRFLSVATRLAPELVGIQSETVIADKLNHALETALLSLSEDVF